MCGSERDMGFRKEKIKDYFLLDTDVENMFIIEYMADAPGDFVKVYLFGRMYADLGMDVSNEEIARYLGIEHEDVLRAWTYWENMGAIRKIYKDKDNKFDYDTEFRILRDQYYGAGSDSVTPGDEYTLQTAMGNEEIRRMFDSINKVSGRVISTTEMQDIVSWINDFNVTPELVLYGYEYCIKRKKKDSRYIAAVIRNWAMNGLRDVEAVEKYLSENEKRHHMYRRVFKALGFSRNATEEEMRIMDTWFDDMEYSLEKVISACGMTSGIANPNINYVNMVLTNWYEERTGKDASGKSKELTTAEITKYYETLRKREEQEAEDRRNEVYGRVPRIKEIDRELAADSRELSKIIVAGTEDRKERAEEIRKRAEKLNVEKAFLLTDNGFEPDHMEIRYRCPECRDTGVLETGERCQCFGEVSREKIKQLMEAQSSSR